ncbi:MAG: hypothetical protein IKH77_08685 [Clostridia bacterium]|nr:hypothetical protein [Clostridia bacterium]
MAYRVHTMEEANALPEHNFVRSIGRAWASRDRSTGKTRMCIQLDREAFCFLSIFFISSTGALEKYSLDWEAASDSHYEFKNEAAVRRALGAEQLDSRYLDEIMIQYLGSHSPGRLLEAVMPWVTAQYHFD